ncbi:hypothetical protein VOLCADRAFT_73435 [Volvox carteri f. nagariensis]|uniref:Anaphase-promoting complex subunit 4 WD40 domain-containing protein n=1 Tax=Volvox carteri f. nagariensis TaxID=3068 RepID=D8TNI7_VOLCA|nr:uncharacterized protein VOLCADRAFT_73435 [Volvox carteri f. nagariensis]EFJ50847.1 hypothetical protein VOLCADRAFT_73435 [Volvox carteri f. nagariensis]|eukprot:XP_002947859.1 hypothetical protein VOLCADRAFT_73435 [Volvox carteri f. nagariensis]
MDFSDAYRYSGPVPAFSPDGRFVASVAEYRLIIREVETMRVVQLYSCLDRVDSIEWSANSIYVLCGIFSRGTIQVWSVESSEWSCKIDEGPAGVAAVRWSPDGCSVLVVAEFALRVTVWSLTDRKCRYLRGPKHVDRGVAFSADGAHMAVLERSDMKDWASVYDTRTWSEAAHFQLSTSDAADLAWSPEGCVLAVWDSCLKYKVVLVNPRNGSPLATYSAYDHEALGVKLCSWSPAGELLAVGSFDRCARLLDHVTWQPLLTAEHPQAVTAPAGVLVFREVRGRELGWGAGEPDEPAVPASRLHDPAARSSYVLADLPASVPFAKPALDAPSPKLGVGRCAWSGDGRYLATLEDSSGNAVWLWDLTAMELVAVLLHLAPVTDLAWGPRGSTLALVTGTNKVFLWTPGGATIAMLPLPTLQAFGCCWNNTATTLLLRGPEAFCCCYLTA